MGLLAIPSQAWPVDENISAIVLLIGLAVGVDYSMFYLKRSVRSARAGKSESIPSRRPRRRRAAGPHLRPDGDDRHGGDVPHGRQDVQLVRHGDDPRGRDRGARLADRPAGVALVARRPGQQGTRAVPPPPPAAGGRTRWGWILDRVLARPLVSALAATAVLVALALPALGMKTVVPGAEALPHRPPRRADVQPAPEGVPRRAGSSAVVAVKAPSSTRRGAGGDRRAPLAGARHRPRARARDDRRQRVPTVAEIDLPIAGTGRTTPRTRRSPRSATTSSRRRSAP